MIAIHLISLELWICLNIYVASKWGPPHTLSVSVCAFVHFYMESWRAINVLSVSVSIFKSIDKMFIFRFHVIGELYNWIYRFMRRKRQKTTTMPMKPPHWHAKDVDKCLRIYVCVCENRKYSVENVAEYFSLPQPIRYIPCFVFHILYHRHSK